ncbi:hypothetical protein Tsubulata_018932 [Turnera subulata]|uniref:Uncharacterized protein n=1 Tax=Turnera subulata TaxID=218843 RepID=A0A9Q0FYE8_9ROSI|nr:hypothetical protein Tsubulata_018932 [Turnera subulata]
MSALSSSCLSVKTSQAGFLISGSSLNPKDQCLLHVNSSNLSIPTKLRATRRSLAIRASGDGGKSGSSGIFIGGFILGGIVAGTLGCVYAPQISKALAGTDRKELMRKLPKFIYDEEKDLEKTRKRLEDKVAQLNAEIDNVADQIRKGDTQNGAISAPGEVQASP